MNINEHAPAQSTREIDIAATPDAVWSILTDIDRWSTWNRAVSRARLDGAFVPGATFHWISRTASIVSTLQDVERPRRVSWTRESFAMSAVHVWTLEATGTGVRVRTSESFDGWVVWLLRWRFQRFLDRALDAMLLSLKTAAEKPGYARGPAAE
jgi:hypothetical protein